MMKKVFIISKGSHDYTSAMEYGEFHYLSDNTIDKYKVNSMYRIANEFFADSSPDDYILLTGLPVMQVVVCTVFATRHKCLNLLLFKDGKYVERRMIFD